MESRNRDVYNRDQKIKSYSSDVKDTGNDIDTEFSEISPELAYYMDSGGWSEWLNDNYGKYAAVAFAIGSEMLLRNIDEHIRMLKSSPEGTSIADIYDTEYLSAELPSQFLKNYDYRFLCMMESALWKLRRYASDGKSILTGSILDDIVLYAVQMTAEDVMEDMDLGDFSDDIYRETWVDEIAKEHGVKEHLYSGVVVTPESGYHFRDWYSGYSPF